MKTYRLAIVDDEPSIRRGLCLIPWAELGYEVAGLFSDGRDAIAYMEKNAVDAVLTDVRMTHVSGIELAKWISENRPDVQIVMLSGYSEFQYAQAAITYSAARYLLKPTNPDELMQVFRDVHKKLDQLESLKRVERLLSAIDGKRREELIAGGEPAEEDIVEKLARMSESDAQEARIFQKINEFLEKSENMGATQSDIANFLAVSPSYLSRLFHIKTGETFSNYIIRRRISSAKKLLAGSNAKVQDIGKLVGYWDVRHFIKVFNAQTGMSPTEYRRSLRL